MRIRKRGKWSPGHAMGQGGEQQVSIMGDGGERDRMSVDNDG